MHWIVSISRNLLGLFVDDVGFSAAILFWLSAGSLLAPWFGVGMPWRGPLLFLGFACLLAWTCLRQAPRSARAPERSRPKSS